MNSSIWYIWIALLLAQAWVTRHIWYPKSQRQASAEQLFATPMYSGLLTEQSVMLNRRADKAEIKYRLNAKRRQKRNKSDQIYHSVTNGLAQKKCSVFPGPKEAQKQRMNAASFKYSSNGGMPSLRTVNDMGVPVSSK